MLATLYAIHYATGNRTIADWWGAADSPWRNITADEVINAGWSYEHGTPSTIPTNMGWKKAVTNFFGKGEQSLAQFYTAFDTWVRTLDKTVESGIDSILPTDAAVAALAKPTTMGLGVDTASGMCGHRNANHQVVVHS